MCYSAQVIQLIKDAIRFNLRLDYAEALALFLRRRDDPGITVSRAFEANFDSPKNDDERQIKALIDEHRDRMALKYETELFTQKTRLVTAERKLASKITKAAQNDVRVATNKIETAQTKLANLRRTEAKPSDGRIYPQYAGVVIKDEKGYLLTPMRYHCRPSGKPAFYDVKYPGLYNARKDNLEAFWRDHVGSQHALAIVDTLFEIVKLHDLEQRPLHPDEKEQNVILRFQPRPSNPMLVACLYSQWSDQKEPSIPPLQSFAIVTDDPPAEVAAAGHNRCPINLKEQNVDAWLTPKGRSSEELALLADKERPFYEHALAA